MPDARRSSLSSLGPLVRLRRKGTWVVSWPLPSKRVKRPDLTAKEQGSVVQDCSKQHRVGPWICPQDMQAPRHMGFHPANPERWLLEEKASSRAQSQICLLYLQLIPSHSNSIIPVAPHIISYNSSSLHKRNSPSPPCSAVVALASPGLYCPAYYSFLEPSPTHRFLLVSSNIRSRH